MPEQVPREVGDMPWPEVGPGPALASQDEQLQLPGERPPPFWGHRPGEPHQPTSGRQQLPSAEQLSSAEQRLLGQPVGSPDQPDWHRLDRLTPLVFAARSLIVVGVVMFEDLSAGQGGTSNAVVVIVLAALALANFVLGLVRLAVTRWALDGPSLRIDTGLLRRDARQLPLGRIQAVDVVRPFIARAVGLAELRVRLAGAGRSSGRLAYLSEPVALELRARLLAGHHGLDQSTPSPEQRPMASVPTGRLVGAALLTPAAGIAIALVVTIGVLAVLVPAAAAGTAGTLVLYLFAFGRITWRRVVDQYGFSVSLAPDGIRIQRGLLSTVSETVPFARVQAVRKIQPLPWRLFGWCRIEVDVAGSPGREQGTRSSRVTKSLLPVGRADLADSLLVALLGLRQFQLHRAPGRARWKAPLSYHFLSAGSEGSVVAATGGRVRKVTVWLPFEKIQSVRRVQGPVQQRLGLATVHVDAAGRRASAHLRDRDIAEAGRLYAQLVAGGHAARQRASALARHPAEPAPGATSMPEQRL